MTFPNSTSATTASGRTPRYSAVHLLIAIAVMFVTSPFIEDLPHGDTIEGALFTAVMLSGLVVVSARGALVSGIVLAGLAISTHWLSFFRPEFLVLSMVSAIGFVGLVIVRLLLYVLQTDEVNYETLCASVAGFLMIGLLWMVGFKLLGILDPGAFSFAQSGQTMDGFESFYFSFVTLTTIGFGDIAPVSKVARMLAILEAIAGMFYVALLVARLVSIHSTSGPRKWGGTPP